MELTQRMDSAGFAHPPLRGSSYNKIGFLGISGTTYPVVLGVNKVGRDPSCHVSLDNQTVSRQHAVLNAHSEREVLIMDMGSANGTKLDNAVLAPYMPCPLRNGDVVQFGDVLGVFRAQPEPAADDFAATQRCAASPPPTARPQLRIPESPENSDLDDSLISLQKNQSLTFRNSGKKSDLPNISELKNKSMRDCSLFEADTEPPPPDPEDVKKPLHDSRIFEAETQLPTIPANDSIFEAETQVDRNPCDVSGIFDAETEVDRNLTSRDNRIFEAETQVETRPLDNIHNAATQVPFSANDSIYEKNTQVQDERKDIHIAETQVWLGRSPINSTPETSTPEEKTAAENTEKQNSEQSAIDGVETQIWPELGPIPSPEEKELCTAETQIWSEVDAVDSPKQNRPVVKEIDFAETQIWPEPTTAKAKEISKEGSVEKVIEEEAETTSQIVPEEPIVSPTLPSPSKKKSNAPASVKSDQSDQEIAFNEMECDDFMICASQTVMESDFDQPLEERNDNEEARQKYLEDLPTQVLENDFKTPFTRYVAEKSMEDIEDMATQIIPDETDCAAKSKDERDKRHGFEDMATQVLPDDDDILTQIIPTSINLRNPEPEPFEDMLTQVIPEPQTEKKPEEIVFKVPHASPMKKKRSTNLTPVSSPRKKLVELEENYYSATQDIMMDLSDGRAILPVVAGLRRQGSGGSQSGSGDSQSQSFNQLCLDDLDLPNSQEITRAVSPSEKHIPRPCLSTSQLSSESEEDAPIPDILYKAPPKKKQTKQTKIISDTASRRSGRPRKPTAKMQEAEITDLLECDNDSDSLPSHKPRSRRIKVEKESPTSKREKEQIVEMEPVELKKTHSSIKIKEERKSSEKGRKKDSTSKSDKSSIDLTSSDRNNREENLSLPSKKELRPKSSRRIKEEKKSPTNEKEKTRRSKKDIEVRTTSETDLSSYGLRIKEEFPSEPEKNTRRRQGNKKEQPKTSLESDKSIVDLTKPLRTYSRNRKTATPTAELEKTSIDLTKTSLRCSEKKRYKEPKDISNSELETPCTDHNLRRSKRLKTEPESEQSLSLNCSKAYDAEPTGRRKRSHGDRNSQKVEQNKTEKESRTRSKRARIEDKNSQGRGSTEPQHRVLLTSFPPDAVADVKKMLHELGAVVVEDVSACSVLVSPTLRRTVKLLCCAGLGRPVVGRRWLEACAAERKMRDPWKYILRDEAAEARYGCSLEKTLRGPRGFLRGRRVAATPAVRPPPDELRKIIECSGGTWCEDEPDSGVLCVTSEEDRPQWARLRRRGATLLHVDFILTGVLRQQSDFTHFQLP